MILKSTNRETARRGKVSAHRYFPFEQVPQLAGEDHPDTLTSANNLALDLAARGEHEAARQLDEDTLDRRRRVLDEDHPHTLRSAARLAADLTALGEHERARLLQEWIRSQGRS